MKAKGGSSSDAGRGEYWRDLIQQQAASGQSVHAFCAARGFTEQSFYYWRKRLNAKAPVSFALVRTEAAAGHPVADMVLEVGTNRRLRIPEGVDAATLRTVLMVLREQA
jgi:hypothetical protein